MFYLCVTINSHVYVGRQLAGGNISRCSFRQLTGMGWREQLEMCALSRVGAAPTHSTLIIGQLLCFGMSWRCTNSIHTINYPIILSWNELMLHQLISQTFNWPIIKPRLSWMVWCNCYSQLSYWIIIKIFYEHKINIMRNTTLVIRFSSFVSFGSTCQTCLFLIYINIYIE